MTTHTGSWVLTEIGAGPRGAAGQFYITERESGKLVLAGIPHGTPELAANARLIACAPDLYAVCKSLLAACEFKSGYGLEPAIEAVKLHCRAAIAKAEGREKET